MSFEVAPDNFDAAQLWGLFWQRATEREPQAPLADVNRTVAEHDNGRLGPKTRLWTADPVECFQLGDMVLSNTLFQRPVSGVMWRN